MQSINTETQTLAIFEKLADILSGKTDIDEAKEIIAPDLRLHLNELDMHSYRAWKIWVTYLHTHHKYTNFGAKWLSLETHDDGTLTAIGVWYGDYKGKHYTSNEASVRYRIENGRIVDIWTKRANYTFFFGPLIKYKWGSYLIVLWLWVWNRFYKKI